MVPLLRLIRIHQWPKNAFVAAALVFSGSFTSLPTVGAAALAVALFCLASSAVYVANDLCDLNADRRHPTKQLRPIASGRISPRLAALLGAALALGSILGSLALGPKFAALLGSYLLLQLGYSLWLKRYAIVDVLTVASGYVVRVVAGAAAIGVTFTPWLLMATFFLTLTMALVKRHQELLWDERSGSDAATRPVLAAYTAAAVQQMVTIAATATLITYSLYTFAAHETPVFLVTIPPVVYTLLRFLLLSQRTEAHAATNYFTRDRGLWLGAVSWIILTAAAVALTELD